MTRARTLADLGSQSLATDAELASGLAVKAPIDSPTFTGAVTIPGIDTGAWTAYTPIWYSNSGTQPSLGNANVLAEYTRIGKTIHFYLQIIFGSTTSFGSDTWIFTVPVQMANGAHANSFTGRMDDFGAATYGVYGYSRDSTTFFVGNVNGSQLLGPNTPFVWQSNDMIAIGGTYESN